MISSGYQPRSSSPSFEDVAGSTRVVSRSVYGTEDALKTVMDMGMLQGISETWDRLAEHLAAQSG